MARVVGGFAVSCAEQLHDWRARALRLEEEVGKAILGKAKTFSARLSYILRCLIERLT